MKKASRIVSMFSRSIIKITTKFIKFGAVLGGLVVAALVLLVKNAFKVIDATAKLSDAIGISIRDLEGLKLAADIAGASQEILIKALEKLPKVLGDASIGIGTAKDALKILNLGLSDLIGKDPAEQFKIIAESIKKLGTVEQKAAAAAALFGRAGIKLLNTLNLGRVGIEKMIDKNEKLGNSFSRISAAKIEEANDALTFLGRLLSGVGKTLSIKLAPLITLAANKLVDLGTSGAGVGTKIQTMINNIKDGFITLVETFVFTKAKLQEFLAVFQAGLAGLTFGEAKVILMERAVQNLNDAEAALDRIKRGGTRFDIEKFFKKISKASDEAAKKIKKQVDIEKEQRKGIQKITELFKKQEILRAEGKSITDQAKTAQERLNEKVERLNFLLKENVITQETFNRAIKQANMLIQKPPVVKKLPIVIENIFPQKLRDEIIEAFETMQDKARSIFEQTRTPAERFKKKVEEIKKLFQEGFFKDLGGEDTFKRALKNARDAFKKPNEIKGAAKQFNLALVGFGGINLNKEGKQIDEQKKTNKILRRIEKGFKVQAIVAQ